MVSELSEDEYQETIAYCLNPCFSGGWSQSAAVAAEYKAKDGVLILVLVEDGLREDKYVFLSENVDSLNPCFSGGWSQRHRKSQKDRVCKRS